MKRFIIQIRPATRGNYKMDNDLDALLESHLRETNDVYIDRHYEPSRYFEELANDIREHRCEPRYLRAKVMPPGLPNYELGEFISALCIAKRPGYWLVYDDQENTFYAFWGSSEDDLGAHGVVGSPIYCWTA